MVPTIMPGPVRSAVSSPVRFAPFASAGLASPKSASLAYPLAATRMLAGLNIAMQDARAVGCGEAIGHAQQQSDNRPPGALLGHCPIPEGALIDEFGNQVLPAFK